MSLDAASEKNVGFIGLGAMGRPMSDHLLAAGHSVIGFDVSALARDAHENNGGRVALSLGDVAVSADVVVTSLPGASALLDVLEQFGVARAGRARQELTGQEPLVVIETSTLTLAEKRQAQSVASRHGIALVDCTVSGTSAQARAGDLVAYLSSDDGLAAERARDVVAGFAREIFDVGEFGNGTKTKLVANTLVAIHNLAAAEALLLATLSGLDIELTMRAVAAGAGGSRMLEVRGPLMISGEYEPATARVEIFRKDIRAIRDLADKAGCPMPLLAAATVYYEAAAAQGRGGQDAACVFTVLQGMATKPSLDLEHSPSIISHEVRTES